MTEFKINLFISTGFKSLLCFLMIIKQQNYFKNFTEKIWLVLQSHIATLRKTGGGQDFFFLQS